MGMEYVTQKKRKGNGITMVKKKSNKFKRHFSHRFMRVPVRAQSQAPRGHTRGTGRGRAQLFVVFCWTRTGAGVVQCVRLQTCKMCAPLRVSHGA